MKNILLLTASVRQDGSASRSAARHFVQKLRDAAPDLRVVERDLGARPPAHVDGKWVLAQHTPAASRGPEQKAALAVSDEMIAELKAADAVVIATPMYNFAVPSPLKAWIDAVARSGETFTYDAASGGFKGLLGGKRALVLVASAGDYAPGGPAAAADFATPYLRFILQFLGITEVAAVALPNQAGEGRDAASLAARAKLDELARAWSA